MKMRLKSSRALLLMTMLSFSHGALAKEKAVDFRPFEGRFAGTTYAWEAPNFGIAGTAAKAFFVSSKDGRSGTLVIQSFETAPDPQYHIWMGNTYVFSANHTVTIGYAVPGSGGNGSFPGKFRWKPFQFGGSVLATIPLADGAVISLQIRFLAIGRSRTVKMRQTCFLPYFDNTTYYYTCDLGMK